MTEEPSATDEVAHAFDELLNLNDDLRNTDLEPSKDDDDYNAFLKNLPEDPTTTTPVNSDRFFKKKWKSWKKKAKKSVKRARKSWKKGYRGVRKSWKRGYRGVRKSWKRGYRGARKSWKRGYRGLRKSWKRLYRGRRSLRRISWRGVSKAWGRMRRAAKQTGKWMKRICQRRPTACSLKKLSKRIRKLARQNRRWFEQRTRFLPKPVRWLARKWYKFSSYSLDGISIRFRLYQQFKDGVNIAANWWNPCGWARYSWAGPACTSKWWDLQRSAVLLSITQAAPGKNKRNLGKGI